MITVKELLQIKERNVESIKLAEELSLILGGKEERAIYMGRRVEEVDKYIEKARQMGGVYRHPGVFADFLDNLSGHVIVLLKSAGAFTAAYKLIMAYLKKDQYRSITFKTPHADLTIKGHSVFQAKAVFAVLFPKGINQENSKKETHNAEPKKLSKPAKKAVALDKKKSTRKSKS